VHGWGFVGPGKAMAGEDGHRGRGEEKIRPQVRHNLHPQAQQSPVPLYRCLDVHRMTSTVESQHILPALLHPLHRTAQAHGQVRDDNLFGVHAALFAKTAADVRSHYAHTVLRSVQQRGQLVLDLMRVLGGVPHGQHIVLGLVVGHDAACLQRCWRQALHAVALPDNVLGLRKGRFQVTAGREESQADVGAQLRVHRRCLQRFQGIDDRRQRLIVHPDQGHGIADQVALLGDDNGHGLPGVTHLAAREERVDGRAQLLRFGLPPGRQGLDHPLQVICGDDGDHPRRVAGRCRIDGPDGGVSVGAAQHRRIQHILEREIVEKRALPGEQSRIF
jgi:hypothetical protein